MEFSELLGLRLEDMWYNVGLLSPLETEKIDYDYRFPVLNRVVLSSRNNGPVGPL